MFKKVLIALSIVVFAGGLWVIVKAIFPTAKEKASQVLDGDIKLPLPQTQK